MKIPHRSAALASAAGRRAFTYIELTMVAAIIGILAAIAIPNLLAAQVRASVSRTKADLAVVNMAIEAYRLEHRSYPLNSVPGQASPWDLIGLTTPVPFLSSLPNDALLEQAVRGSRHPRPVDPIPYRYFNGVQVSPELGVRPANAESAVHLSGYTAALLWGWGPAGALGLEPQDPYIRISPEGLAEVRPYDPSNGTTSPGDIFRTIP